MARPVQIRQLLCALAAVLVTLAVTATQASAAPTIKRAAAVDADGDGRVDAFDVTFSAKVLKAKGKARGRSPFAVRGYRVTGLGAAKGRRVRVRVAERSVCDLGVKPRITFRGGPQLTDSRKRRMRRSRIDLGRRDRRRPRITCAVTGDRDGDGHIDSLMLTWSRPVRSPASTGGGQFGVDRYSIASVAAARGRFVTHAPQGEVRVSTRVRCPRSSTAGPAGPRAACAPRPGAAAWRPAPPTTTPAIAPWPAWSPPTPRTPG